MIKMRDKRTGQVTPFMLAVVVVLLAAVMVTINVGKISLSKTHSANAVDSGALAGASAMANVFNMIADGNVQMIAEYKEFFLTTTLALGMTEDRTYSTVKDITTQIDNATKIAEKGSSDPCGVIADTLKLSVDTYKISNSIATKLIKDLVGIQAGILAYQLRKWNFYKSLRDAALLGHDSAMDLSFQLAYSNSGLSEKLLSENIPKDKKDLHGDKNNYQKSYRKFINEISTENNPESSSQSYKWSDGQDRNHKVEASIYIDPPKRYKMRITEFSMPAMSGYIAGISSLEGSALGLLSAAGGIYMGAQIAFDIACALTKVPITKALGLAMAEAASAAVLVGVGISYGAIGSLSTAGSLMPGVLGGLAPGSTEWVDKPDYSQIPCWLEEVGSSEDKKHNGKVSMDIKLSDAGTDLTLWKMQYPDIKNKGFADFRIKHKGEIYKPDPSFASQLIEEPGKDEKSK